VPAATDDYTSLSGTAWNAPATHAAAVTPSDSTDLGHVTRWIYVGGSGGNLEVIMADGSDVTLTSMAAGSLLPMRVSRVKAASTTATGIVALW
jgi:hypothetical protein